MTRARILQQAKPAPRASGNALPWLSDACENNQRPHPRRSWRMPRLPALPAMPNALKPRDWAAMLAAMMPARRDAAAPIIMPPPSRTSASKDQPAMGLRKRIAVLLAIVTVPAMAAPGEFAMFSAPQSAPVAPDPMQLAAARALPFERPGMSFPGSAFYFLDDPPEDALIALPTADPLQAGAEEGRQLGEFIRSGPAASPFFAGGAGVSHARALQCLAQAVWYEAASESEAGQRAVAQVVLNRVTHPGWPASVCGVVYQGSERRAGCQFSFTCDGSLARQAGGASWARAQAIASEALAGKVYAPVGHATHYHTLWVNPYWASTLDHVGTIGAHRFYRTRGAAGEKSAFTLAYSGFEPSIAAISRSGETAADQFITAATERSSSSASGNAAASGRNKDAAGRTARPAPGTSDETKPEFVSAGEVRPEYSKAGQWKTDPASLSASQKAAPKQNAERDHTHRKEGD